MWLGALQIGQVEGDNPEEIKKQKAIKGLLNKLTPEKFEKILSDIIAVGYETEETESGLIDQVHTIHLINLYIVFPYATRSCNIQIGTAAPEPIKHWCSC